MTLRSGLLVIVFTQSLALFAGLIYEQATPFWRQQDYSVRTQDPSSTEKTRSARAKQEMIAFPKSEDNLVVPVAIIWRIIAGVSAPLVGGVYFGVKWFWRKHEADINGIDARAQAAISELKEHVETNRKEMRDGIVGLHAKIETNVATIGAKQDRQFEQIMGALMQRNE